jgi:ABC-type phosphate transport system permease subunit
LFSLGLALFLITLVVLSLAKWMLIRAETQKGMKS